MDQLKAYWIILKRQHFWVLSGLVVLISIVGWFLAVSSLKQEQAKNTSDIESKRQSATQVRGVENHPNDTIHTRMESLISARKTEVLSAWRERDAQLRTQLQWPAVFHKSFVEVVTKLLPVEVKLPFPLPATQQEPLRQDQRELYKDFIGPELPKLAERIGAVWAPAATGGGPGVFGGSVGGGAGGIASGMIVNWNSANQAEIEQEHFKWGGRSGGSGGFGIGDGAAGKAYDGTPTTLEVMYAQEDLWVLSALVNIVRQTNAGATVQHNAAIKQIDFLRLGRLAGMSAGQVTRIAAGGAPADAAGGSGQAASAASTSASGFDGGGTTAVAVDPAESRYVDKFYKPLPAAALRTAIGSADPNNAYLAVAKRMPIRMRFLMDQRKINDLLAQCASSDLTVEVRQVRISRPAAQASSSGPGAGAFLEGTRTGDGPGAGPATGAVVGEDMLADTLGLGQGGSAAFGGSASSTPRRRGREAPFGGDFGGAGGAPQPASNANPFPFDVSVEVFGIIYIFNPVDESKLNGDAAAAPGGPIAQL